MESKIPVAYRIIATIPS